jgi:hypothetical protein
MALTSASCLVPGRQPDRFCAAPLDRFALFIDDGRICLTSNIAERALRGSPDRFAGWLDRRREAGRTA